MAEYTFEVGKYWVCFCIGEFGKISLKIYDDKKMAAEKILTIPEVKDIISHLNEVLIEMIIAKKIG